MINQKEQKITHITLLTHIAGNKELDYYFFRDSNNKVIKSIESQKVLNDMLETYSNSLMDGSSEYAQDSTYLSAQFQHILDLQKR